MSADPERGDDATRRVEWVSPSPLWEPTAADRQQGPPQLPPVPSTSAPPPGVAAATRWSRRKRWALGLSIAAAGVGLVAVIVGGTIALATALVDAVGLGAQPAAPLIEGPPGDAAPMVATECDDPCFGVSHLGEARLFTRDFELLGTPKVLDPEGWYADSSAREQYDRSFEYWREVAFEPDDCFFTATETPTALVAGEPPVDTSDSIHWLRSFETADQRSYAVRALRFFDTAEQAAEHLASLRNLVSGCSQFESPLWLMSVTPMPAITTPDTVAAVGWVQSVEGGGRYYVVDVLRSNAVIRLLVSTDNAVSELAFRRLAETMAADLGDWPLRVEDDFYRYDGEPEAGFQPEQGGAEGPRESCIGECFTAEQALALAPTNADIDDLGLRRAGDAVPVAATAGAALDVRQAIETSNAQCRFALGIEPVVRGNPTAGSGARSDELVDLGRVERSGTSIRIVARVFENEARAEAYAAAATFASRLCSRQTLATAQGDVEVVTTPAQIVGYDSISDPIVTNRATSHVGWQQSGGLTDRGHELQHGNIVVRVVIETAGSSALTEQEVARLMLPVIERFEALEPPG